MEIFDSIVRLLNQLISGFLRIATPIAIITFIICCIGAFISTDQKDHFKRGIIWVVIVYILVLSARGLFAFLQGIV
jgi:type IV secretory pathway VirB2 component (pilin)